MKKKIILLVALATGFLACNESTTKDSNDSATVYSKESAEDHNEAKFDNKAEKEAQFVVNASSNHLTTIALCNLAMERAVHSDVKTLAGEIKAQHANANRQLEELAQLKGISYPTQPDLDNSDYKSLDGKTGIDFDKAYYNRIVDLQKDAIQMYQEASTDLADADLREYSTHQLPSIRVQLDRSMDNKKVAENWE